MKKNHQARNNRLWVMSRRQPSLRPLAALILLALPALSYAEMYFPPALVSVDPDAIADLSYLTPAGTQMPGSYEVEMYLNGNWLAARSVRFVTVDSVPDTPREVTAEKGKDIRDATGLMACLTPDDWRDIGLKMEAVPSMTGLAEDQCISPGRYISQAYTAFDFEKMRLDISIPQAMVKNQPRGWIPPERWDEGINALLLGYRLNGSNSHSRSTGMDSSNLYLNLDNGLNVGPWRLRDNRTWSRYTTTGGRSRSKWDRLNTYVERAIIPLRSRLLLGESTTDGDLFDAFSFKGARLATDDSMYPDTQRGFAPLVKGAAFSNARVSIRQNGNLIYQTFVPPGAFVIDDLYPVTSGGDLNVTVTEADGTARTFVVPYSSVPLLQREGRVRYSVTAGRFRSNSDRYDDPEFAQGTLQWGLPYDTTVYGGLQMAEKYHAGMVGVGVNMASWGALSADFTHASSELADGSSHKGQSVRFLYARSMNSLGTTFRLAGYRYSTKGFHTLDETALKGMSGWLYDYDSLDAEGRPVQRPYTDYYNLYNTKKSRMQANISQRFGRYGSLYLTGTRQNYWNSDKTTDSLMFGYSASLGPVNYNLSWSYSKGSSQDHSDRTANLSFSLPLSALLPGKQDIRGPQTRLNGNASRNSNGRTSYTAGLSGTLLEDHNLGWNLQQGYTRQGDNGGEDGGSGNANVDYRGTYGSASLGYSYSQDYRQVNYGISGGAVVHRNGLTLGQQPGTTSILVAAPGAAGVPVSNGTGVKTDWRGYALLPYSSEYRETRVELDASSLDEQTELEETSVRVVPTRGALVRADFKAHSGVRVLMRLTYQGKPLPFGTTVSGSNSSGITGDDGVVFLSGMESEGELQVQWGKGANHKCTVRYRITEQQMQSSPIQLSEVCVQR
ncbi:fimbria/pilus outer membrane usher protein [Serratia odorifera]|uniref:Fimbrial usher protein n=2 Tax=Serratia odorifera TaxID=618 RepID=D4E250_SEROD|nr:fimbria/pilus outer membrane usher protein [Serratia odorifera]EFE96111.1 fimbrial usher protein [Serratia odorifera DSM 4582]VDZ58331.1 Outer membrane usher protein fimD precursor [Serratia odorifera]